MDLTTGNIILIGSILLIISILAGKTSFRFGVPTLILFLLVGILAGSEGIGRIHFDDPKTAQFIGIISLNFILFSGGLETEWRTIKPVLWQGMTLSTLGVLLTTCIVGVFVTYIADFSLYEGLLLGAIVSSTDAAAVFSILRSRQVALKHNLRPLLGLESGSNDPMAYLLTIALMGLVLNPDENILSIVPLFLKQVLIGGIAGVILGKLSKELINRIKLEFEGLYPVLVIALMSFVFSFTDYLNGNGFLAVYLSAVILGNEELIHKKTILKAFDGFAWLMQIVLFLTLGLLVFPSEVYPIMGVGLLISAFLILVARPISIFVCLSFFKFSNRSKFFLSWVGLRGAVPIVFATYPLLAGVEKAHMIFNIVFFISVTSVLIQGTTLSKIAKWLHVSLPEKMKRKTAVDLALSESIKSELEEIILPEGSAVAGKEIIDLNSPKSALITIIRRDGKYIIPTGSTALAPLDQLYILTENKESLLEAFESLKLKQ